MAAFQTKEVAAALGEELTDERAMTEVISALRDEISVLSVKGGLGPQSRPLSMVLAKLDEARLWAIEYGMTTHTHLLVDKRDYAEGLEKTAELPPGKGTTHETVSSANGGG